MRKMVKLACTIKQAVRYYITDDKLGEVEKCDIIITLNARKKISTGSSEKLYFLLLSIKKVSAVKKNYFLQTIMIEEDVNKVIKTLNKI